MLSAADVGKYFLMSGDDEGRDLISNLKLQKLVYYAQGVNLALYDAPLFAEAIVVWHHGPVVPSLYQEYKDFGDKAVDPPKELDLAQYSAQEREVLDEVYSFFGQFSAWKLRHMTRDEAPCKSTPINHEISHEVMLDYFKTIVSG